MGKPQEKWENPKIKKGRKNLNRQRNNFPKSSTSGQNLLIYTYTCSLYNCVGLLEIFFFRFSLVSSWVFFCHWKGKNRLFLEKKPNPVVGEEFFLTKF